MTAIRVMVLVGLLGTSARAESKFDATRIPGGTTWWCGSMKLCFRSKPACDRFTKPCKGQVTAWGYTNAKRNLLVFASKAACAESLKDHPDGSPCTAVGARALKPFKPMAKGSGFWCFERKGVVPSLCAREQETCQTLRKGFSGAASECHATKTAWAFVIESGDFSDYAPLVETRARCTAMFEESLTAIAPCRELR
jgi:hypothetical protein